MTEHSDIDHVSGRSTTGHEWDGIKELNTPLPRWWVITFYADHCLGDRLLDRVSGVAAALEPHDRHLELLHPRRGRHRTRQSGKDPRRQDGGARRGAAGGDREGSRLAGAGPRPRQDGVRRQLRAMPRQRRRRRQGLSQPERRRMAVGRQPRPDHADDPVRRPFRASEDPRERHAGLRQGGRPQEGPDRDRRQLRPVACRACRRAPGYDAAAGAKIFADNCTSCHGDNGKGNQELGAPDLTDKIWLYGSDEATLVETISNGRAGVMPAWVGRLDPSTIKALTVYVHSLGGGK